jgi:hypothetical protein
MKVDKNLQQQFSNKQTIKESSLNPKAKTYSYIRITIATTTTKRAGGGKEGESK